MSLQHIQKNSPRLLPKPAKFEKNPPNGYRVIRKTNCGAGGAAGAGSSPIHKQASLAGRLMMYHAVVRKIANLISKLNFYKLIPYPMDNCFTGPAKRQKKTSCIYYRQDRSQSVHSPGGASYFISCLHLLTS